MKKYFLNYFIELARQADKRLPVAIETEDNLSDLSEDDDIIVPEEDETHQNVEIRLTVTPTTHPKVKELFNNTNEVNSSNTVIDRIYNQIRSIMLEILINKVILKIV